MNAKELRQFVGTTGRNIAQVEKDYLQHVAMLGLSRRMAGMMVFKGGTALQKCGLTNRFSEDLDFTLTEDMQLVDVASAIARRLHSYGYESIIDKVEENDFSSGFRLKIKGPCYEKPLSICTIRVDMSRREEVLMPGDAVEIVPPYPDVPPYIVATMNREEIISEKARAIMTGRRARDLFDLHSLLRAGVPFSKKLANKKLSFYELKMNKRKFISRIQEFKRGWLMELEQLVEKPPKFDEVKKETLDMMFGE